LDDILYGGDATVVDLDDVTFNTISKWLRLKSVWWMHYPHHLASLNNGLGLFSIVGFPWLHHTSSLADVTMEIKACTLPEAVKLY
jgi:hypothetical protein